MEKYDEVDLKKVVYDELHLKSPLAQQNNHVNNLYAKHEQRINNLDKKDLVKVVMMSDLHMDWDYLPGADNSCGKPLCCRSDSGPAPTTERTAGKWGDFNCDLN